eukprot:scaffold123743_cov57-Phaeocystis_antarctica.AAC.8
MRDKVLNTATVLPRSYPLGTLRQTAPRKSESDVHVVLLRGNVLTRAAVVRATEAAAHCTGGSSGRPQRGRPRDLALMDDGTSAGRPLVRRCLLRRRPGDVPRGRGPFCVVTRQHDTGRAARLAATRRALACSRGGGRRHRRLPRRRRVQAVTPLSTHRRLSVERRLEQGRRASGGERPPSGGRLPAYSDRLPLPRRRRLQRRVRRARAELHL